MIQYYFHLSTMTEELIKVQDALLKAQQKKTLKKKKSEKKK